jgi:DNA-binding response OmpR family regulator
MDGKRRGGQFLWLRSSIVLKRDIPMVEDEISFGRFRLDLARRELRRDETLVRLGSWALDILCVLASAGGQGSETELLRFQRCRAGGENFRGEPPRRVMKQ